MKKVKSIDDLSFEAVKDFLERIGNPHYKLRNIIHIAGTNGKGSTTAICFSLLKQSGYKVNVFTSPHLVSYNERIRINGEAISNQELAEIRQSLDKYYEFHNLSIFEQTTIIAIIAFNKNKADFNIFEVGLGGRLDATNVVTPTLCLMTKIDLDHQHILGNSLSKIAYEKAGIIKNEAPVVSSLQSSEVENILQKICDKNRSKFFTQNKDYLIDKNFLIFNEEKIDLSSLSLLGEHQFINASICIYALLKVLQIKNLKIKEGLLNTYWPARLQRVNSLYNMTSNNIFVDGTHNPIGFSLLFKFIKDNNFKKVYLFFGLLKSKDLCNIIDIFAEYKQLVEVIPTEVTSTNCFTKEEITKACYEKEVSVRNISKDNLSKELILKKDEAFITCGSLYLAGEVLKENNILVK